MRLLPLMLTGAVLGASSAAAQAPKAKAPSAVHAPTRVGGAEAAAEIPDAEKIRIGKEAVARMQSVLKDVLGRVEEARHTKDVVKLNCVNEKLSQIRGLVRISEQAGTSLQEAIAKGETSTAAHEFTKLSIARERVDQLRGDTEQCIGQLAFRTDENMIVEVTEPAGLPDDPTRPPDVAPVPSRPQAASPVQ